MKKISFYKQVFIIILFTFIPVCLTAQTWESYYELAKTEFTNKNYRKCIEYCNQSIAVKSTGGAYWERAAAKYNLKEYSGAITDYTTAIPYYSKNSSLASLHYFRGLCYYESGKNAEAITDFNSSAEYGYSNMKSLYWYRGVAYFNTAAYEKSITEYNKAISLYTDDANLLILHRNISESYIKMDQFDEALTRINKAMLNAPNKSYLYKVRSGVYIKQKKYDLAKADYDNAMILETEDKDISNLYFDRSMKLGWVTLDYKSALDDLNKSIALDPNDGMKFWHRSITFGYKKDNIKSLADCNKAIQLYNEKVPAGLYELRASLKEKAGDFKGAIGDYQLALKTDDKNATMYYNIGRLFKIKLKNNVLAGPNLAKAIELDKSDGTPSSTYAYAKVIAGETQEAIAFILENIEKNKDDSYQYKWQLHNAACIYSLAGNKVKALEYLDKSLAAGYDDYDHLVNDRDLVSLTALPQYKVILTKYKVPQPKW